MDYFYQGQQLATLTQDSEYFSILSNGAQALALLRKAHDRAESGVVASDPSGSLIAVRFLKTDVRKTYSVYGHTLATTAVPLGFTGAHCDSFTEHYLLGNGYRAYNPVQMRFNSPDSWSPFGEGGLNAYAYGSGDPVNGSDPSGHAYIGRVKIIQPGLHAYYKKGFFGGKKELRIIMHGRPGSGEYNGTVKAAGAIIADLKAGGVDPSKHTTRFYTCFSATPNPATQSSLIQDFSRLTGKPAIGYDGTVSIAAETQHARRTSSSPTMVFKHFKKNPHPPEHPDYSTFTSTAVKALPQSATATSIRR
ncbi:RHS repeat-associated core domain-containing protein [Pseudomonas reidholzensis]